jgi:diguanylate cyclase (GGDEF)-like protein
MQKASVQMDGVLAALPDTRAGQRVGMVSAIAPALGLHAHPIPHLAQRDTAIPRHNPLLAAASSVATTSRGIDEVTGLLTRSQFHTTLQNTLSARKRADEQLTVLFLGLDNLRRINSCYGHAVGDKLLRAVVHRQQCNVISRNGVTCRFSGDQFSVLIQGDADVGYGADIPKALAVPYDLDGASITLSASVGIARYPVDSRDADALLQFADTAMYAAKESGGHGARWFAPEMKESRLTT